MRKNPYDNQQFQDDYLKILPPGTESNGSLYGELIFTLGDLAWLKISFPPENIKMRVKFWGQNGAGRIVVAKNAAEDLKNIYPNDLQYEIRCPVLLFHKYLRDMVKLRIDVLDKRNDKVIGVIAMNMLLFLKPNPKVDNNAIEDIKGLFPIFRGQTYCFHKPSEEFEKIGEIDIEITSKFSKYPISKAFPPNMKDPTKNNLDSSFLMNEIRSQGQDQNKSNDKSFDQAERMKSKQRIAEAQQLLSQQQIIEQEKRQIAEDKKQLQQLKEQKNQGKDEEEGENEMIQRKLKEKQNEHYLKLLEKQEQPLESTIFSRSEPPLAPDLELMKLRMDEAELISGLLSNVYSDLTNLPENMPDQESLDLKSVTGYAVKLDSFLLTNQIFKRRLQQSQLFLNIQLPNFQEEQQQQAAGPLLVNKVFYDSLLVACRKALNLEIMRFEFDQGFPCKLKLSQSNIADFTDSRVYFTIQIAPHDDASNKIDFAKGEFRFDQLLLKPYFRGQFDIQLFSAPSFIVPGKGAKKAGKADENKSTLTGELSISVCLLNELSQYAPDKLTIPKNNQKRQIIIEKGNEIPVSISQIPFQMAIYINSISEFSKALLPGNTLFIRHKIYGRHETVEGQMTTLDQNRVQFQYKTILPVDHSSFSRMNNNPFVIEVWKKFYSSPAPSYTPEEFLGIIRVNLKTIPGLLINPFAFASNLLPTVLIDGSIPVWDPSENRNAAFAHLTFAFGTVQQISIYNQNKSQQQTLPTQSLKDNKVTFQPKNTKNITIVEDESIPGIKNQQRLFLIEQNNQDNISQSESVLEQNRHSQNQSQINDKPILIPQVNMIRFEGMEYSKEAINKVFVMIMENIRRNKRRAQNVLRNFVVKAEKHEKRVTIREFYDFLNDIPVQEALQVKNGYLHKLVAILDFEEIGEILTPDFVKSYNSFLNYEDILRDSYTSAVKEFALLLASKQFNVADFERILYRQSEFGFVRRDVFKYLLEKDLQCESLLVSRLSDLLDTAEDGLILANLLPDYLRSLEVYEKLNYISCDYRRYSELVKQNLQENLSKNEQGVQELLQNDELADKELNARDIQYLVQGLGLEISFWESLCIIESIRIQLGIPATEPQDEFKLPFVYLADWLAYIMRQKKEDPQFNYFSYLVEQRNRIQDEHLFNAHLLKAHLDSHRSDAQSIQNNSSARKGKYPNYRNKVDNQSQIEENEEDELIQLVNKNYKK